MSGASKRPYSYSYAKAVSRSETDLRWRKARHCRKRPFLFACGHQYGSGASYCWLRNAMQVLVRHQSETACAANQNGTIDNPHSASVAGGSRAGHDGLGGSIQIQDAGDKFANGDPQVAPESALQAGVILRAAEQIAHQLPEHRAAAQELNHASGHRAAEERSAIEAPHDARREFQFGAESSLHPSRVLFRAAFCKRAAQQFAGANGIEKAFACEGINPGGRISDERPVLTDDVSFGKRAFLW